jgi:hypothetical protein
MEIASRVRTVGIRYVGSAFMWKASRGPRGPLAPLANDLVAQQVAVEDLVEGAEAAEPWLARVGDRLVQRRFGVGCGLAVSVVLTG